MTAAALGRGVIPASADREDVDPSSTSIAFEPCRVEDVLPSEFISAISELSAARIKQVAAPGFSGNYTPYALRNLNALVSLGLIEDAFRLLSVALAGRRPSGWRHWAEVVWSELRVPEYIGDMPHTWIGAEFATAVRRMLLREYGDTLELLRAVPDAWWAGEGITLRDLPTSFGMPICGRDAINPKRRSIWPCRVRRRRESPFDIQAPSKLERMANRAIFTAM
jgi:hypothetical protein